MLNFIFFLIVGFVVLDFTLSTILGWLNRRAASPILPESLKGIYDAEEYSTQQKYFKENNRFASIIRTFEFGLMLIMLFSGGFGYFDMLAYTLAPSPVLAALLFFAIIFLGNDILTLPFAYYENFIIEEKNGFNNMKPSLFFSDKIKG